MWLVNGVKSIGRDQPVKVLDIAELLDGANEI
jgi:hypothetical protein